MTRFEKWMEKRLGPPPYLRGFRELWDAATAAERERCAGIADAEIISPVGSTEDMAHNQACRYIAAAIREGE